MLTNIDILIDQELSLDAAQNIAAQIRAAAVALGLDPAHVHVDVSQQPEDHNG